MSDQYDNSEDNEERAEKQRRKAREKLNKIQERIPVASETGTLPEDVNNQLDELGNLVIQLKSKL